MAERKSKNSRSRRFSFRHTTTLRPLRDSRTCPARPLSYSNARSDHPSVAELSDDDIRAIILALMRIEEKLDELFGEDDDDGEE